MTAVAVVVPTVGRPSLVALLSALAHAAGPRPQQIVLVDDRPVLDGDLLDAVPAELGGLVKVQRGRARGPAAARNDGWRATDTPWVAFVDDDVVPGPTWLADLQADLAAAHDGVGAVQGRIRVPLPPDRRPTDWERNVAGLEQARWPTADMAYRRPALASVGGFDERFPRAYREDADLALRVLGAGWELTLGRRAVEHPVRPADAWVSVRLQRGNADDALMAAIHGRDWRERASVPRGRRPRHVAVTAAALAAAAGALTGHRRAALAAGALWAAGSAELAWARVAPGPRTAREVAAMVTTSVAIPPAATWHSVRGLATRRRLLRSPGAPRPDVPAAVLFDRDGTLVRDVPYNSDPARVEPMPGARAALDRVRRAGIAVGVVSNQSGVARGLLTDADVEAVNGRLVELLGPFDAVVVCPHGPDDGCPCRKPQPGMIHAAAEIIGVPPERCAVVGDIAADVGAALAAGARGVLVPTDVTRPGEVARTAEVAGDIGQAVDLLLSGVRP